MNMSGIYRVYSDYIQLFCVPSYNIEGWTLNPATESFCTLHILIEAISHHHENKILFGNHIVEIYQVYSWNIYGKSIYLVYTWYIPEQNFLSDKNAF